MVQEMLRELDPEGCMLRKARRLKKREYINPGPNYAWHMDGYDKLKPQGAFQFMGALMGSVDVYYGYMFANQTIFQAYLVHIF